MSHDILSNINALGLCRLGIISLFNGLNSVEIGDMDGIEMRSMDNILKQMAPALYIK
jgi:hypothetical protein